MSDEPTMIDRAARAIYYGKARNKRWELLQPEFQRQYEKQARAAIEAMSTPTHEMRLAAWKLLDDNAKAGNLQAGRIPGNGMPDAILSVMIDAALNEHANAR